MIRRRALLTAVLSLAPIAASAAEVWTAGATEKIRPDAAPRAAREATLGAARNEFEAFQIVVAGPARNVTARASAFVGGPGATHRLDDVKLWYRVDTIAVASPSAVDGGTGRWPDIPGLASAGGCGSSGGFGAGALLVLPILLAAALRRRAAARRTAR